MKMKNQMMVVQMVPYHVTARSSGWKLNDGLYFPDVAWASVRKSRGHPRLNEHHQRVLMYKYFIFEAPVDTFELYGCRFVREVSEDNKDVAVGAMLNEQAVEG
jgi:hypothetical protein